MNNKLGVVTCYFNPCGYRKRLENYHKFRKHILHDQVQLLTVELAFDDKPFELSGDVLQLRSNSVMWHKERLLNIGIEQLIADGFTKIMWCDADMVFMNSGWTSGVLRKLDQAPLAQCFDYALQQYSNMEQTQPGLVCSLKDGEVTEDNYFGNVMGGCWAITAEMYARIGKLYDYYIIGGGDAAFALAAASHYLDVDYMRFFGDKQKWMSEVTCKNYIEWLTRFRLAMSGCELGYVPMGAMFLPHGKTTDRQYNDRYSMAKGFDHTLDLLHDRDGVFTWGSPKFEMHAAVKKYFMDRREDA